MEDGFVKEPAVVTRATSTPRPACRPRGRAIKLEDGVRLHESVKVELETYARENGVKPVVKPFMLVIARDTTHAAACWQLDPVRRLLRGALQGQGHPGGLQQDRRGRRGDDRAAAGGGDTDEPTEIVIHVNMLKEGWDVTNLYTIVPLRAANARTLIEQSIGRGLRLPYGKRTGVAAVDRLNIVAHDKFQEIIDEANRGDSGQSRISPNSSPATTPPRQVRQPTTSGRR
jgi:type III restriction enzyme